MYLRLTPRSITSWTQLEEAFLQRFQVPVESNILYHQFVNTKKFRHEPVRNFNDKFQNAYGKVVQPHTIFAAEALQMYIKALDALTIAFVRREVGIKTLQQAYASAATIERQLTQNTEGEKATNLMHLLGSLNSNSAKALPQPAILNPT